jgi:hypothetical protein
MTCISRVYHGSRPLPDRGRWQHGLRVSSVQTTLVWTASDHTLHPIKLPTHLCGCSPFFPRLIPPFPCFPSILPSLHHPLPHNQPCLPLSDPRNTHTNQTQHEHRSPQTVRPTPAQRLQTVRRSANDRNRDRSADDKPPTPPDALASLPAPPVPTELTEALRDDDPGQQPQQRDLLRRVPLQQRRLGPAPT